MNERALVAHDALAWLDAGALEAGNGGYVCPTVGGARYHRNEPSDMPLRDAVLGRCRVCAIGGLFLARAVRRPTITVGDLCTPGLHRHLADLFGDRQLQLIEVAYEANQDFATGKGEDSRLACLFGARHGDRTERLRAILQNVIDHDGEFVP